MAAPTTLESAAPDPFCPRPFSAGVPAHSGLVRNVIAYAFGGGVLCTWIWAQRVLCAPCDMGHRLEGGVNERKDLRSGRLRLLVGVERRPDGDHGGWGGPSPAWEGGPCPSAEH